jgi:hypothetical protein
MVGTGGYRPRPVRMPTEGALSIGLLLHQGGWDEVLMVAAALGIAYLVIVWTGRRSQDESDEVEEDEVMGPDVQR